MFEQLNLFDIMQEPADVPSVNEKGYIPAELLQPIRWEAWKFAKSDWTMLNGEPYVIDAILAILPGNRLYVKNWMLYPFMHELKSAIDVEKMYHSIRKEIVEREEHNNKIQRTWQVNELPPLEDMWKYKDGEYSCKKYAEKMLYGYKMA